MGDKLDAEFRKMRENLTKILKSNESKFSFTVDAWWARNRASYYGITIHFIDNDWNLVSTTLDIVASKGKHSGRDIANMFWSILEDFGIVDKVQGLVMDNASANTTFVAEFSSIMGQHNLEFDAEDGHFRCLSHIINLGARDTLALMDVHVQEHNLQATNSKELSDDEYDSDDESAISPPVGKLVKNVRCINKKIKNSEVLSNRLQSSCDAAGINFKKPILDVTTRWNSTFEMLDSAFKMKAALAILCENDPVFRSLKLTSDDWQLLKKILDFLKYFKVVSDKICGEKYITLPIAIIAFNLLLDKIETIVFDLDQNVERTGADESLIIAFQKGRDKLLKHYSKCNWMYCVALVFDPRHKLVSFDLSTWGREMKAITLEKLKYVYKNQYYDKINICGPVSRRSQEGTNDKEEGNDLDFDFLYVKQNVDVDWESEINLYLNQERAASNINILDWWKCHSGTYPLLSKMARDILCVPATSVPVERVFSEGSLVVTKNRCSLKDDKIRALMCINGWMKSSLRSKICEV